MELANQQCSACRPGSPMVSADEETVLTREIPDWEIVETNGVRKLKRAYSFPAWMDGIQFAGRIGELAEQADHHPTITITWGKVTVIWWTHAIAGLHRNDFIMAARSDRSYAGDVSF